MSTFQVPTSPLRSVCSRRSRLSHLTSLFLIVFFVVSKCGDRERVDESDSTNARRRRAAAGIHDFDDVSMTVHGSFVLSSASIDVHDG